ncbi:Protein phosphatase 1 regulatory subunit 12B [Eumeta japonica]|uniref:Protein phosphatase 1 regulatory subunit 12B n=1 Tax=Eumeta variegata TaxID=151549 RepID=A0A4C1ZXH5_EUMVA|nr:Protein phosphatase 1 regulatory subunit 12B [Eumeta japonica]
MSRKQDNRYSSRPRGLTTHFGSSPLLGSQYNPYSSNFSNSLGSKSYRNYNPYIAGFGRTSSNLGIYGGTSSGYGGVYLNGPGVLSSLNLMSPVLKNLDKKLLASQKNFKPKEIVPVKIKEPLPAEVPPTRPERKSRAVNRSHSLNKEKSRSLTSLDDAGALSSRSLSLNSLASDGYCERTSGSERTSEVETPALTNNAAAGPTDERDYKALYEASSAEVRRLRELLNTSEQQLRDARSTISRLTRMSQSSLSEIEKREKRAMERKLSEMEEELKQLQKLKAENERLRAENRALTRVVSKLTNSAGI